MNGAGGQRVPVDGGYCGRYAGRRRLQREELAAGKLSNLVPLPVNAFRAFDMRLGKFGSLANTQASLNSSASSAATKTHI